MCRRTKPSGRSATRLSGVRCRTHLARLVHGFACHMRIASDWLPGTQTASWSAAKTRQRAWRLWLWVAWYAAPSYPWLLQWHCCACVHACCTHVLWPDMVVGAEACPVNLRAGGASRDEQRRCSKQDSFRAEPAGGHHGRHACHAVPAVPWLRGDAHGRGACAHPSCSSGGLCSGLRTAKLLQCTRNAVLVSWIAGLQAFWPLLSSVLVSNQEFYNCGMVVLLHVKVFSGALTVSLLVHLRRRGQASPLWSLRMRRRRRLRCRASRTSRLRPQMPLASAMPSSKGTAAAQDGIAACMS